jgi:hypothetical protein
MCLGAMTVRYAVLLKIHYWDAFAERRLKHLLGKVGSGDVYLFVDETHGPVPNIPHDKIIRATESDMAKLDVVLDPPGKVFWYSVDYPLYYFYLLNPSYDYYLMFEHDAVCNIDVDEFVQAVDRDQVDYVAFPLTPNNWPLRSGRGVYPDNIQLHQSLNCISLHSKESVAFLLERRQALTRSYATGDIPSWPNNELFVATEMHNNGFVVRSLGDFGKVDRYDWWPPTHEDDLAQLGNQAFLHPVLDEKRYLASCMRFSDLTTYFSSDGQLYRLLNRWSPLFILPAFLKELARRAVRKATPSFILNLIPRARNAGNFRRLIRG